jgi:hypothetical protein
MKKFLVAMGASLLVGVALVSAQQTAKFTYDTAYEVADLGLTFAIPSTWVMDSASNTFAETEEALASAIDDSDDESTPLKAVVARVGVFTYEDLGLKADVSLDEIADMLFNGVIEEKEARATFPVLSRRAVIAFGALPSGDAILGIWTQGDKVVLVAWGFPADVSYLDYAYDYGTFLGSIRPTGGLDIPQQVTNELRNTTVNLPEDWLYKEYADAGISAVYSNADDTPVLEQNTGRLEGVVILILQLNYSDYGLEENATGDDLRKAMETLAINAVYQGEYIVNGKMGYAYSASTTADEATANQTYNVVTMNPETQQLDIYILSGANAENRDANVGNFNFILSLIKDVE